MTKDKKQYKHVGSVTDQSFRDEINKKVKQWGFEDKNNNDEWCSICHPDEES